MMAMIMGPLGVKDFALAGQMTLKEYRLRKRGYAMICLEREKELHLQAFLNRNVKATKSNGEYIYKEFKDFYDADKRNEEVLHRKQTVSVNSRLFDVANKVKKMREEGIYE